MLGKLTDHEIEHVLHEQLVGRIGCHANGKTYVVPISYAYDGEFLYMHTWEGLKINIMRNNPDVCFEVEAFENMANWKTVITWGKFEEITDPAERNLALQKLIKRHLPILSSETAHLTPHWPFEPPDISTIEGIVFKIVVHDKTGRFEKTEQARPVSKALV